MTTYEVFLTDFDDLKEIDWKFLIVDEGHRLKNKEAKLLEVKNSLDVQLRTVVNLFVGSTQAELQSTLVDDGYTDSEQH